MLTGVLLCAYGSSYIIMSGIGIRAMDLVAITMVQRWKAPFWVWKTVLELCLLVFCVLDVISSPEGSIRNLPKLVWLVLVIVLPLAGGIAWLVAGRPQGAARSLPYKGNTGIPPEYDRPGRATAYSPDDDAAFLAQLKARAEEQRKKASEQAKRLRDQEDEAPPA